LEAIEPGRPKVAFLGTMLELGVRADDLHTALLADARAMKVDVVVATGAFAAVANTGKPVGEERSLVAVSDPLDAYRALFPRLAGDEVILLKASRGVVLEQVIPLFEHDFGGDEAGPREGRS